VTSVRRGLAFRNPQRQHDCAHHGRRSQNQSGLTVTVSEGSLCRRGEWLRCRSPESPQARAELGDFDLTLGLAQLLGPLLFGRLTGVRAIGRDDCIRIVDDFFIAHQPA